VAELDARRPNAWRELAWHSGKQARLLVPVGQAGNQAFRLRVWSLDRRGAPIAVQAQSIVPRRYREQKLPNTGIALQPVAGTDQTTPDFAVAEIKLTHPGVFKVPDTEKVIWSSRLDQPLRETYNGLMTATGTTLWVARLTNKKSTSPNLVIERVVFGKKPSDDQTTGTLQLLAAASQTSQLDVLDSRQPMLIIAESRTGQAGVQLINQPISALRDIRRFAVARQSAVSVLLQPESPILNIWNAADGTESLELSVRKMLFSVNQPKTVSTGEFHQALPASESVALNVPQGLKRMALVFPAEMAAVLLQGDLILSTHWSGKTPLNEVTYSLADKIMIFNASGQVQHFALSIADVPRVDASALEVIPELRPGHIFKQHMANTGQLRIPVKANGDGNTIRIRGVAQGTFLQTDGRIARGTDLAVSSSGVLILEHQPGVVYAWLDSSMPDRTQTPVPLLDVTTTQVIPLQGEQTVFQITANQAMHLQLRSDSPLISRIVYADGREIVEAHGYAMNYAVYLPAGPNRVVLESLGASAMNSTATVSAIPVVSIVEGYGPESMLGGGDTRMYSFKVKQHSPIGVGVQASADVVSGVLMDSAGKIISRGVVHMPELAPGRYVFVITVPTNSLPVRVRPAIVGLEQPPSGPPKEVIKRYLQQAGRKLESPSDQ
jgi:hypothetical protein